MTKNEQKVSSERASEGAELKLPPGVKLARTLRGHTGWIGRIAWSPDGRTLASPSADRSIRLWDAKTGKCIRTLEGHHDAVWSLAFEPSGQILVSGDGAGAIKWWEVKSGQLLRTLKTFEGRIHYIAVDPSGRTLASQYDDDTVGLWNIATGRLLHKFGGQTGSLTSIAFDVSGRILAISGINGVSIWKTINNKLINVLKSDGSIVWGIAFHPTSHTLASASGDKTIKLWDVMSGKLKRTLEGHVNKVEAVAFSADGQLLASKSKEGDEVFLWNFETGEVIARLTVKSTNTDGCERIAFHPKLPILATAEPEIKDCGIINLWELNPAILLGQVPTIQTSHYVNAKVVLLGDTGVGKSGLSLVLNGKRYKKTDSTPGRKVWTFSSQEVLLDKKLKQTREALLWDLAGQPGYRVIHQLHLNEVAVALVVFDARSETDPLAGVRHWERALRLAQQRQASPVPLKKLLVSARNDRGTVSVSKERLDALLKEFEFDGYFETSAKEGWQIKELRQAIEQGIPWDDLPEVSSSILFANIKSFLLKAKKTGRLVAPAGQLYDDFARTHPKVVNAEPSLSDQFETCIGRLENRDLIRRLSFGGYVLLQPELLDAYASAMVNAAKEEPDGLGSIAEEAALAGQFYVPKEQKILDRGQEQLLLHATVEELARYDLALRESAADGRYLVFPSQFNRDYEAAPEPKGKALALRFDGPVQSLYSTLAVRLGHSGLFTTGRAEMWRNAAVFTAKAGGKCGLYLHEFEEARGRLVIFYDHHEGQQPSDETRFHFEEFVLAHAQRHALTGTVELVRFFVCAKCGNPVPDNYVKILRDQGVKTFDCPCRAKVSLEEPKERLRFASKVETMGRSADRQRDFEMFVESARGETSTPSFAAWAGDDRVMLAIVFTDVVGSTALGEELKDAGMKDLRRAHFAQSRKLIEQYKGREVKTIGDSFMAAFRSVGKALDYSAALQSNPGHARIKIRAGIHIGSMTVEENDVFGGTVNFAARVVSAIKGPEIWLSTQAKEDLESDGAMQHMQLEWERKDGVEMKGFNGLFTLWSLTK